jgi:murein DD-endopeptidase MepM/ murein hydrolase activator NlpD
MEITERSFITEEIPLDQANTRILTVEDPQKTREAEQLWTILNHSGAGIYSAGPFIPPLSSTRRTSYFGDRRVFIYSDGGRDRSIHGGVDYGVPTGTPVWACAAGKVVLACFRIVTGNSVVIEHLPGVYSLYYHLDSIAVSEGQLLKVGEPLGQSGATGLATGPHLHWEIRVAGENADPDILTARSVLDKALILSRLEG